jgi:hypothetical protein
MILRTFDSRGVLACRRQPATQFANADEKIVATPLHGDKITGGEP